MWFFTKDGFYSVVKDEKCADDELLVESITEKDMENLMAKIPKIRDIKYHPRRYVQYNHSVIVARKDLAKYISTSILDIDYDNQNAIVEFDDLQRKDAYMKCYSAINEYQKSVLYNKFRDTENK